MDQPVASVRPIAAAEFGRLRSFVYEHAGISLSPENRRLVPGRLLKRLHHHGITTHGDYLRQVMGDAAEAEAERQLLIDCLTSNETRFPHERGAGDKVVAKGAGSGRGRSLGPSPGAAGIGRLLRRRQEGLTRVAHRSRMDRRGGPAGPSTRPPSAGR